MPAPMASSIPATLSSRPPTKTSPMTPVLNEPFNIDGFPLTWPAEQFRHKGPTALDEIRREPPVNETPQFGFITGRRFTGFRVLSMALAPMVRLGANNVSMLPRASVLACFEISAKSSASVFSNRELVQEIPAES